MQERAIQSCDGRERCRQPPDAAVEIVADDRKSRFAQMDANLMRASRMNSYAHERNAIQRFDAGDDRLRVTRMPRAARDALAMLRIAAERLVEGASDCRPSPHERGVCLVDEPVVKLLRKRAMRAQLAAANLHLLTPEQYNQLFTVHGVTMIFLYAAPILSGFSNYLWPLMLGSRDMAFPRLNALSYWLFVGAGLFIY